MPRLTTEQTRALANWWDLAQSAGFGGYTATDTIEAASDIASQFGRSLTFSESTAIAVLYGYAKRMSNAADNLQAALDSDTIIADHIATPPWARDEAVMNTAPIWHVSYLMTFIDADGELQSEYKTSVFEMTMPDTIGGLKDAITEDAQALASKYGVAFSGIDLAQILAV